MEDGGVQTSQLSSKLHNTSGPSNGIKKGVRQRVGSGKVDQKGLVGKVGGKTTSPCATAKQVNKKSIASQKVSSLGHCEGFTRKNKWITERKWSTDARRLGEHVRSKKHPIAKVPRRKTCDRDRQTNEKGE